MKRRILSLFLVIIMVLGMLPVQVFAAETALEVSENVIDIDNVQHTYGTIAYMKVNGADVFSASQDGTTINVILKPGTDESASVSVVFSGNGMLNNQNSSGKLSSGKLTLNPTVLFMNNSRPMGNVNYTVHFSILSGEPVTVTPPTGEGFTFIGDETAYKDSAYSFSVTVNEGYDGTAMAVKVNDEVLTGENGKYTVDNVTTDLIITVDGLVKKEVCNITAPTGEGFVFSGAQTVYKGESYSFTVTVNNAYIGTDMVVLANGVDLVGENGSYTVDAVSEDTVITVTGIVKKEIYSVTLTEGDGYTLSGQETSYAGEPYTFSVSVDDAVYFADQTIVRVNDDIVTLTAGKYTFEALDSDKTVTVEVFERQLFTVTKPEAEGVTFTGGESVRDGKDYTFGITVADTHNAADMTVKLNGEEISLVNGSYTVTAVNENLIITIEGVIAKTVYQVTVPTGDKFTFSGLDYAYEGEDYTFTVTPNAGYLVTVKVGDQTLTPNADGTYTVTGVSDHMTITVAIEREPLPETELSVSGNVIDITDKLIHEYRTGRSATAETITISGADVANAYEDGTTVYVMLSKVTADDAVINAAINVNAYRSYTISGNTGSTTLANGEGGLDLTVTAKYTSSKSGTVTYNIVFLREEFTAVPSRLAESDSVSVYTDDAIKFDLSKYFADAAAYYLVNGEEKTQIDGTVYTFTPENGGEHKLVFGASNPCGDCPDTVEITVSLSAPTRLTESASASAYTGVTAKLDMSLYFEGADEYYLVNGEDKTPIEGMVYAFTPTEGGEITLTFGAKNKFGDCPDTVDVTVNVTAIESGAWIGHTTSNGSLNYVLFYDADGNLIDGVSASVEENTIQATLPKSYPINGKIKAVFNLTQNGSYPFLSTKTATTGTTNSQAVHNKFTEKTITLNAGKAFFTFYYFNSAPNGKNQETWQLNFKVANNLPVLAEGVEASVNAEIIAGENYTLDLAPLFTDADGDALTYLVSINGAAAVTADANYAYTNEVAGTYTLVFTANDTKDTSAESYTVTLNVKNSDLTDSMTVSVPAGLVPQFYVCTGFEGGTDVQGAALEAAVGETVDSMTAYTVSYPVNAEMIGFRAEGFGGMAFTAEKDTAVSLRQVRFAVVDYNDETAESTDTVTYGGNTAVSGENGWLLVTGLDYVMTAAPKDTSLAKASKTVTLDAGDGIYTEAFKLGLNNPLCITVPTGAVAQLYQYKQYYSNTEFEAKIITDNGDGTATYQFSADSKNGSGYIYRVSMEGKITKAGWLDWGVQNLTVTYTENDKAPSWRLDDYAQTGEANSAYTEDSVLVNVNSRNHLALSVGQSKTLKAYRAWEIIPVSYNNWIISPDFTYTILSGDDVVSLTEKASPSAGNGDWMTLKAEKEGIAVIEVTYDAIDVSGKNQITGVYGASDPNRSGLIVVQVGGTDDTSVKFGIDGFASSGSSHSDHISYNPNSKKEWDAEFDTLYFAEDSGTLTLTPTASTAISEVAVSHDKGATWTVLNGDNSTYTAEIVPGNNIIRVTTESGTAYQVVRGDKITVKLTEIAGEGKSDGDGEIEAGEAVRVTLVGLHTPIPKMAGNYNPGYGGNYDGYNSQHLNYTANGTAIYGTGAQYNFINSANYIDIVMPEDGSSVKLTDGYIGLGVIGLTAFTDGGDSHRNIPDGGCTTRDSKTTYHTRSILPEITVTTGDAPAENQAPIVRTDAVTEAGIYNDQNYAINPETLFIDPDSNTLTFTVSVNGAEAVDAAADYKFTPNGVGTYSLLFTATDGRESVQHTLTLTVTARPTVDPEPDVPEEEKIIFGLKESEIAGYVSISFVDFGVRVTGETGLRFPVPLGTIIAPTSVPFKQRDKISHVTRRLLDHLGIGMSYSGSLDRGFYLGAISNFEVNNTPYASMGEFDAGAGSGWMITQNGTFIQMGASEFAVENGDVITWKYTCQLGADIGDPFYEKANQVIRLIDAIGDVDLSKADQIMTVKNAYDALDAEQQKKVSNYSKLTNAIEQLAALQAEAENDRKSAEEVIALIDAIGTVTSNSGDAIKSARAAYNALTDIQKALVTNAAALAAAERAFASLNQPQTPDTPEMPDTPDIPDAPVVKEEVTIKPEIGVDASGEAKADIQTEAITDALAQAEQEQSSMLTVAPEIKEEASKITVSMPADSMNKVAESGLDIKVSTTIADVTLSNEAISELSKTHGDLSVTSEAQQDGSIVIDVAVDGISTEHISSGLVVAISAEQVSNTSVIVVVHEDGSEHVVKKSVSDTDGVTALLNGSATIKVIDNKQEFHDTDEHWGVEYIDFAASRGLFCGIGNNTFDPNGKMTRAMLATTLYRLEDAAFDGSCMFDDVPADTWYTDAVAWANENSIVLGTGNGFDPNGDITREQLATMLYRYAKMIGMDMDSFSAQTSYEDHDEISDWAADAMNWAVGVGLILGKDTGLLDPSGYATRSEVAVIYQRMIALMVK